MATTFHVLSKQLMRLYNRNHVEDMYHPFLDFTDAQNESAPKFELGGWGKFVVVNSSRVGQFSKHTIEDYERNGFVVGKLFV